MKLYTSYNYLKNQIKIKSIKDIANENDVSKKTIQRYLCKFKLTKPSRKWTEYELKVLRKNYSTDRELFDKLKERSFSSIYHKANRKKLRRTVKPLKYNIDEGFFNDWTKEFAYFLGFFMADGHINLKTRTASIKLQNRDEYILMTFLKFFKTNRELAYEQGYPKIRINNSLIIKRLVDLGCYPCSSLKNSYPTEMSDKYFFHFLRGFIDGDGSIYICKSKKSRQKNVLRVNILGSKEFLEFLIQKISFFLNRKINYKICRRKDCILPLHEVTFNGELARLLCYNLYKDSKGLCLERKKEKFKTHLDMRNKYETGYGH